MRRTLSTILATGLATLAACGGETEEATAAKVPREFFGVVPQDVPSPAEYERMGRGNVGSYHLLFSWRRIEVERGVYEWREYDRIAGHLAEEGITPIPYVFGTPQHLSDHVTEPPTAMSGGLAAWKRFLKAAARRYGPDGEFWNIFEIQHPGIPPQPFTVWEIWNEQNGPAFWRPRPDPEAYAKLVKVSDRVLNKIDPHSETMVAGMFATPSSDFAIHAFEFLRRVYRVPGAREAIDGVGIHPYGKNLEEVETQIERTRKIMNGHGDSAADTWVTEIGWASDSTIDSDLAKSPGIQAQLLSGAYDMFLANREDWRLRAALWYSWRDPDPANEHLCEWCPAAGLLDRDLDAKPAWLAFTRFTGGEP